MLITSILGLLCNLVMVKILHSDQNYKHEGCNHHHHNNVPISHDTVKQTLPENEL
jgi:Co/Zn/Cd efflux system component